MIAYTWNIVSLAKRDFPELNLSNVVVSVTWKKTGTDESGRSYSYVCESPVHPPINSSKFIDLDDISEEQLIEWAMTSLDDSAISAIDTIIEREIEKMELPPVEVVPWEKPKAKKAKKKSK